MSIIRDGAQSADLDAPVTSPTLSLDFANSQELDPRITFTRGSVGTFVNRNGLIETIPANQPRFDYDPISGECRGLLIEESRQNLIVNSNYFGLGDTNIGITENIAISPDGSNNASLIYEKNTLSFKLASLGATTVIGTTYCGSIFVKYSGTKIYARIKLGASNGITINLKTGAFVSGGGSYGIIAYPNGWYRIYSTWTATTTSDAMQVFLMNADNTTSLYQGDGSSGYYIYGAQVEAGTFPTSYIPTTASTVTRSADTVTMTETNFSSWYNQTESTILCNFNAYNLMSTVLRNVLQISGPEPSGLNRIQLLLNGPGGGGTTQPIYHNLYQNGPNFADYFGFTYRTGLTKNVMRYKDGDAFVAVKDGGRVTKNTSTPRGLTIPLTKTMNSLTFRTFNGAISKFSYYPKALNDAEIQYLTQ